MSTRKVLAVVMAGALGLSASAGPNKTFDRFKALTGDWVSAEDTDYAKKGDLIARYHLTGGGSAVVEDLFPGTPHEMTTVYHMDGEDLVLTHYCAGGNQPRMRAKAPEGDVVSFAFDGGTNIDPKKTRHMHDARIQFVSENEIRAEWNGLADGKPGMTVKTHLVRKAS
jgi:hypothetical protein